jgi:hypothetical protein
LTPQYILSEKHRQVTRKGLADMIANMEQMGYLKEEKMLLKPLGNGKFLCLDGNHRLAAIRELMKRGYTQDNKPPPKWCADIVKVRFKVTVGNKCKIRLLLYLFSFNSDRLS